ncbi:23S rRNA pseudouridine2605 synthase [Inquilinus ginsengisoli]|uniref:Pseudouridine synthase n=1 Tax=Inquilinus ginsengisoli TaxID=363840 RepID=A0ABU1JPD0_9PROT|nr:pseudouridine synthase [Inquilinus ginsengisoli]MDR6290481.1 23S rRNA pseudouridine2605 synthase [Inquilinus ginsengisoli]
MSKTDHETTVGKTAGDTAAKGAATPVPNPKPAMGARPAAKPAPKPKGTFKDGGEKDGERVAKVLARAGMCSRREAERWIAEGRVAINGKVLETPAVVVPPGAVLSVDGVAVPDPERTRLWRYHKPAGLVTTRVDPQGRQTVFDNLPEELPRVVSIGRLDLNSEGLLLLTNDGELSRRLELPSTGWPRRYRVRVHGAPDPAKLAGLAGGITVSGVNYGPIEAELDKVQGANAWLTITLREGKNREVRKVMEAIGLNVNRLIRISYGPFQLGILEKGKAEEVKASVLRDQLGRWMDNREEEPPKPRAAARPATAPKPPAGPKSSTGPAPRHAPAPRRRPA